MGTAHPQYITKLTIAYRGNRYSQVPVTLSLEKEIDKMPKKVALMQEKKRIALIAHDHNKPDLLEWVKFNRGTLLKHELYATGTTGELLEKELGLKITTFEIGPLGGTNRLAHVYPKGALTFSSSSGTLWRRCRMTHT